MLGFASCVVHSEPCHFASSSGRTGQHVEKPTLYAYMVVAPEGSTCSRLLLQDSAQSLHNLAHMLPAVCAKGPHTKAPAHIEFIPLMSCSWQVRIILNLACSHAERVDPALGTDGSSPIWQTGKFTR